MIDAVNVAAQTVNVNSPVLFGSTRIKTGCTVRHEAGSGRFVLLKPGVYEISFSANMTSAAAATATFNITQDGEQIAGAKIVSTIAAAGVNNVSCTTSRGSIAVMSAPSPWSMLVPQLSMCPMPI